MERIGGTWLMRALGTAIGTLVVITAFVATSPRANCTRLYLHRP